MSKENRYVLGLCDYNNTGKKNCEAAITWTFCGGKFSMSAEIWNPRKTDIYCGGQCVDEVAALFPKDKQAQRMAEVWELYHLNDMKAYSPAMKAAGWDKLAEKKVLGFEFVRDDATSKLAQKAEEKAKEAARMGRAFSPSAEEQAALNTPYSVKVWVLEGEPEPKAPERMERARDLWGHNKGGLKHPEGKTLGWLSPEEHPQGLLGRKLKPEDAEGYGQKWWKHEIPADVKAEILSWTIKRGAEPVDSFAAWLDARYKMQAEYRGVEEGRDCYTCTIEPKEGKLKRLRIEWQQGQAHRKTREGKPWSEREERARYSSIGRFTFSPRESAPSIKQVLDAAIRDAQAYRDYADHLEFIAAFGYEDAKQGRRVWQACEAQNAKLQEFFGPDYGRIMDADGWAGDETKQAQA